MPDVKNLHLGREVLGGTLAKIVMAVAGFAGTILFARVLGPTAFGGVALVVTLFRVIDKPMSGWGIAGKKRVSEDTDATAEIVGGQLLANVAWIGVVTIGLFLAGDFLGPLTGLQHTPRYLLALLGTVGVFSTIQSILKGHGKVSRATWIDTLRSYLTFPLQAALVLLGWGAGGMVYGLAAASAVLIPVTMYQLRTLPALPTRSILVSLWEYARYSIPSNAFNLLYNKLDVLILGALLTPSAVGYYDVAWKLTLPAMFLAQTAGSSLMSKLSALESDDDASHTDLVNTLSFTSLFAFPAFTGALVLHESIVVTLYGPSYRPAGVLLIGLAGFRVVATQSQPLVNSLNGVDRPDVTMWITGSTVVGNVLVGVPLTITFGPIGVIIATILAESARYVASVIVLRRELSQFPLVTRPMLEQIGAAVVMGGVVFGAKTVLPVAGWPDLAVLVGSGATIYGSILLAVSKQLRQTLRRSVVETTGAFRNP